MTDFGFTLKKSSAINLDTVDLSLYNRLCGQVPEAKTCMSCGSCSATCTAGQFSDMSVRKVILNLQRGRDVEPLVRNCLLCGKCSMVCPRGINTRHLLLTLSSIYDNR